MVSPSLKKAPQDWETRGLIEAISRSLGKLAPIVIYDYSERRDRLVITELAIGGPITVAIGVRDAES